MNIYKCPEKAGGHVRLTLMVVPVLTGRLFGGIDTPRNVLFAAGKQSDKQLYGGSRPVLFTV